MTSLLLWRWQVPSAQPRADLAILKAMEMNEGIWTGAPLACSRSQLQRLIEEGQVEACDPGQDFTERKPIKANQKLREGTQIQITFPPAKKVDLEPEDRPLDILFEDEHLIVINKPPGLTVHPSSTQMEGTLVNALLHHITDLSGIGGELRPGIVHRIDKDTSGALVISKSDVCHRKLTEIFSTHSIDRIYWALAFGAPSGPCNAKPIRIETQIGRNPKDRKKMAVLKTGGKRAVSYYRKLEEYAASSQPFASFLEVTLETGRTHQVRVHLTSIGHSLLGDPVYGTPSENQAKWKALPRTVQQAIQALPGQALHARVLGFVHPMTGQKLYFEAEPPQGFGHLLETLRGFKL